MVAWLVGWLVEGWVDADTILIGGHAQDDLFAQPLIMTSFVSEAGGNDRQYLLCKDMVSLRKVVEDAWSRSNMGMAQNVES